MNKNKILIIDDEPSFTRLLELILKYKDKYDVRVENKAAKGLAAAKEFKPDLILLDVFMPEIDGSEVAAQIKNDKDLKDTKIIFLTAAILRSETDGPGDVIGGHPFLAKPSTSEEIISCIEEN